MFEKLVIEALLTLYQTIKNLWGRPSVYYWTL